jgi:hypothetical protein
VHGDLPPGRGIVKFEPYLQAIKELKIDGAIPIELEYSPDPKRIVEWVTEAYTQTDKLMSLAGLRGQSGCIDPAGPNRSFWTVISDRRFVRSDHGSIRGVIANAGIIEFQPIIAIGLAHDSVGLGPFNSAFVGRIIRPGSQSADSNYNESCRNQD